MHQTRQSGLHDGVSRWLVPLQAAPSPGTRMAWAMAPMWPVSLLLPWTTAALAALSDQQGAVLLSTTAPHARRGDGLAVRCWRPCKFGGCRRPAMRAGTIGASKNGKGVVGVIPGGVELYIVRVFDENSNQGVIYGSHMINAYSLVSQHACCPAAAIAARWPQPTCCGAVPHPALPS